MNKGTIIAVVLIIAAAAAGFFGGMKYQQSQRGTFTQFAGQMMNGQFRQRFGQNAQNFRPVRGSVLSIDDAGITVKEQDGSSKIVLTTGSTSFVKSDSASKTDIKTGDTIMVFGAANSDGSVTASQVQINPPAMRIAPTIAQ